MKILATFDAKDYQNTVEVCEKSCVRAIILKEGKLAMQCGRDGSYKIPGGGPEDGEDDRVALVREVLEETGLHVIESTIAALGEIVEIRRDLFDLTKKYICRSRFYFCRVGEKQEELRLTSSEEEQGYELRWAAPEEICRENGLSRREPWIMRDTAFVKMLMDGSVLLPDSFG